MILRNLELINFGCFKEKRLDFEAGSNLVLGDNGAGKSTLLESLPAVLFGVKKKDHCQNWGGCGACRVVAIFGDGRKQIRVERDILTDWVLFEEAGEEAPYRFEGKISPLGRCSEREEYRDRISSCFGVSEEELFRASLFCGQGSLAIATRGELESKVKKLLSGSTEVDYDKVLDSLLENYFQITRHNPWGKDKIQNRELERIRDRILELEQCGRDNRERIQRLEDLQKNLRELKTAMAGDREQVAKEKRYLGWVKTTLQREEKERRLQADFRRLQQESDKVSRLHQEQGAIDKILAETRLTPEVSEALPRMLVEIKELRNKSVTLRKEIGELYAHLPKVPEPPWGLIFLIATFGAGVAGFFSQRHPDFLGPTAVTGMATMVVVLYHYSRNWGRILKQRIFIQGQAQLLERDLKAARGRLAELEDLLDRNHLSHGEEDLERLRLLVIRRRDCRQRRREIEGTLEVLEDIQVLARNQAALAREMAILRAQRDSERLEGVLLKAEELPLAEEKLARIEKRLANQERELAELVRQESFLLGELGDVHYLEEEGVFLKERERFLTERKRVLGLAFDLLQSAEEDFRRDSLQRFMSEVGRSIEIITAGKYCDIRMENGFRFALREAQGGWRPLECFSRGTVDAVFLAIRKVLAGQVLGGKRFPLMWDDPMVNFDSQRLTDTLKYLENLGTEHQVLLCSHNRGLLSLIGSNCWHVIDLSC